MYLCRRIQRSTIKLTNEVVSNSPLPAGGTNASLRRGPHKGWRSGVFIRMLRGRSMCERDAIAFGSRLQGSNHSAN